MKCCNQEMKTDVPNGSINGYKVRYNLKVCTICNKVRGMMIPIKPYRKIS